MKKNIYIFLFFLLASTVSVFAQQPFGGCWHPKDIKDWSPEKDPEAKFNRSTVPLQARFYDDGIKANPNQFYDGKITAALTMNPMCSTTPSQGADNFIGYNPSYWQYMDVLIWWGGSAAEGNIIPPSAPVTDIAHLNGVKVLGNLFFAPRGYGGSPGPVNEMLTQDADGTFPYARKLYDIAKYYGFDGWFVNEETSQGAGNWKGFFDDFFAYAASKGDTNMELQWYLAHTKSASTHSIWNVIGQHKQASTFLDYGGTGNAVDDMQFIQNNGYSREEAFSKVYYGVENAKGGLSGNGYEFKQVFPKEGHVGSLALFNPEEHAWKQVVKKLLNTPESKGKEAYAAMQRMYANEARFWTNVQNDPSDVTDRNSWEWPGLANAMQERSTIQTKPFVSSFSAGLGKHRFVNGEKKGTGDWYHRGMQDVLPTWRWWVDAPDANKKDLKFSYHWNNAYNVGNSLLVSGKLVAGVDYLTRLFKTKLEIAAGDKLEFYYRAHSKGSVDLKLTITGSDEFVSFPLTNSQTVKNNWRKATIDLSSLAGKTVSVIALNFKSTENVDNFQYLLGQISILPANYTPLAPQVANVQFTNELKEVGESDIRVVWDAPTSEDVHHYNVYLERGGQKTLVGQTRNEGFYIPKFSQNPGEKAVKVSIATVTKDLKEGVAVELEHKYPALDKTPDVTVTASKTLIKPGEVVLFTADANREPSGYEWVLPEGAELVSGENTNRATVKFAAEGEYDITVKVSNAVGTTTELINCFIHVSSTKELKNLSEKKKIHSESGHNGSEEPKWLLDGNTSPGSLSEKWCAGGRKDHWVVVDLEKVYSLYQIKFYDCRVKEGFENVDNYKIEISQDAEDWTEVLHEKGKEHINVKEAYIKPAVGRYVRFTPYDEEKPLLIRIWEFQVFGTELKGVPSFDAPADKRFDLDDTIIEEFSYVLAEGVQAGSDFAVTVTPENENLVSVSDIKADKEQLKVSYKLTGKELGFTNIIIKMTNAGATTDNVYQVQVKDPSLHNVLKGNIATLESSEGQEAPSYNPIVGNPLVSGGLEAITDENENTVWFGEAIYIGGGRNSTYTLTFDLGAAYEVSEFRVLHLEENSKGAIKNVNLPRYMSIEAYVVNADNPSEGKWEYLKHLSRPADGNNKVVLDKPIVLSKIRLSQEFRYRCPVLREFEALGKKVEGPAVLSIPEVTSEEPAKQLAFNLTTEFSHTFKVNNTGGLFNEKLYLDIIPKEKVAGKGQTLVTIETEKRISIANAAFAEVSFKTILEEGKFKAGDYSLQLKRERKTATSSMKRARAEKNFENIGNPVDLRILTAGGSVGVLRNFDNVQNLKVMQNADQLQVLLPTNTRALYVYDLTGRVISKNSITVGQNEIVLSTASMFKKGIYIIVAEGGYGREKVKFYVK